MSRWIVDADYGDGDDGNGGDGDGNGLKCQSKSGVK